MVWIGQYSFDLNQFINIQVIDIRAELTMSVKASTARLPDILKNVMIIKKKFQKKNSDKIIFIIRYKLQHKQQNSCSKWIGTFSAHSNLPLYPFRVWVSCTMIWCPWNVWCTRDRSERKLRSTISREWPVWRNYSLSCLVWVTLPFLYSRFLQTERLLMW